MRSPGSDERGAAECDAAADSLSCAQPFAEHDPREHDRHDGIQGAEHGDDSCSALRGCERDEDVRAGVEGADGHQDQKQVPRWA